MDGSQPSCVTLNGVFEIGDAPVTGKQRQRKKQKTASQDGPLEIASFIGDLKLHRTGSRSAAAVSKNWRC